MVGKVKVKNFEYNDDVSYIRKESYFPYTKYYLGPWPKIQKHNAPQSKYENEIGRHAC
jgi:hypothetical protein